MSKKVATVLGLVLGPMGLMAQTTNTIASTESAITGAVGAVYQDSVTIAITAIGIGFAIYFIRKGLKARA